MAEKVLVVDDVPVNVKLLADLLAVKGYAVVTAASGAEALETIERDTPDLVLLDVMMPGMSGYDVCRKIRANRATVMLPVVMVTALDPVDARQLDVHQDERRSLALCQPHRVLAVLRLENPISLVRQHVAHELAVLLVVLDDQDQLVCHGFTGSVNVNVAPWSS